MYFSSAGATTRTSLGFDIGAETSDLDVTEQAEASNDSAMTLTAGRLIYVLLNWGGAAS